MNGEKAKSNMGVGIAIGLVLGTAIGAVMNNIGLGAGIGLVLGTAIGAAIKQY
jgi:uncharacterized membrane protein